MLQVNKYTHKNMLNSAQRNANQNKDNSIFHSSDPLLITIVMIWQWGRRHLAHCCRQGIIFGDDDLAIFF
jgi:hypothetical protein